MGAVITPPPATSPRPVLIFDGDCGFCTTSARFVSRWVDRRRRYAVRPWQQLDLAGYGLSDAECLEEAKFVDERGVVHGGHAAISAALTHGAVPWRPVGALIVAPGVARLSARAYRWVAEHRQMLPGGTPACAVTAASR